MVHWLRNSKTASFILLVLRVWLGWQWMVDGFKKLTGPEPFDASGFMKGAIAHPVAGPAGNVLYGPYNAFLQHIALPGSGFFSFLVKWGEFLVGLGLILGTLTTAAAFFALLMNFMYLFAGTVSTNPLDVLIGVLILFAGFNAGKWGGDYWVVPWIRRTVRGWFGKSKGGTELKS
ncbi:MULTISPECIES: DoxX family protein [unclassified Sporolactobacillus]|uniref:DoxX family protein n=1 Tax=unclassified Sporolactobacillus TaxID=2628533 RepID=UPI0023678489|nr:DoxX family protein [Sporolactobacillus sp. CQH2019]MDD9149696.1 DoxX family protein [Sporolactobacillus sp. CQH2019]